ncbi:GTPase-activating protein gyp7 [Rhodotorula sp. JG-1b]|nr:GTPase-activating protein gyp7 [Rhodotorula sp. JG-1b]
MAIGGGPHTPPDLSDQVSSRSSDDLVELMLASTDSNQSLKASGGPVQATEAGSNTAASSPVGSTASRPPATTASVPAGTASPTSNTSTDDNEDERLAELLWCKSAVYLNPSLTAAPNAGMPGFLAIVRTKTEQGGLQHLISWIPEKLVEGTRDFDAFVLVELSSQDERDVLVHLPPPMESTTDPTRSTSPRSYAFSYSIASVYSVQVRPPTLTSWIGTVTISLYGGVTLPPLHFHDDESKSTLLDQDRRALALGVSSSSSATVGGGSAPAAIPLAPSWGGEAFVSRLKKHARVVRSQLDPSVFLINPSRIDLEAHVAGLALTDDGGAVPVGAMQGVRARVTGASGSRGNNGLARSPPEAQQRTSILHQSSPVSGSSGRTRTRMHRAQQLSTGGKPSLQQDEWPDDLDAASSSGTDPGSASMDALTFSVLNGFSRITRSARQISQQAASTVLSHPLAKPLAKHVPKPIAQFALAPGEVSKLTDAAGVGAYDAARVYLAKWARIVAEEGERARKVEYGVDDSAFLGDELGESTGVFEVLAKTYHLKQKPRSTRAPNTPIQLEEWRAWFEPEEGRLLLDEQEAKRRIFQRGLADNDVRKQVWPFLLKLYPWTSTRQERAAIAEAKSAEYDAAKRGWMDDEALHKTERYLEEDHRVEIDCRRTDRTHPLFLSDVPPEEQGAHPPSNAHVMAMHDILMTWVFATSRSASDTPPGTAAAAAEAGEPVTPAPAPRNYVQGMSDLFSPLYVVLEGEQWLCYALFENQMERHADNFLVDQSGMARQLAELQSLLRVMDRGLYHHFETTGSLNLFFCFRWFLTSFKREFSFDDTIKLWEIFFTDYLGTHFHHYFALAILEANRDVIVRYLREFDEILKYINELSQTLDLATLISDAEVLYLTLREIVDASTPAPKPESGLRQRNVGRVADRVVGDFPPTEEDAEEVKRERVRTATRREVETLRTLLE